MIDRNWDALKRPLLIINHLRQGPADKQTLIKAVRQVIPDAYPETSDKAQSRTFERDLENARLRLLAALEWQPRLRQYVLHDPGPFLQSDLSPEALTGLAFLRDSFTTSEEIQRVIRPLLDWVEQSVRRNSYAGWGSSKRRFNSISSASAKGGFIQRCGAK
jgi:hypothetical protein